MDFIINNYLWFGIAGVILLMALIGFLAEKTNFINGGTSKGKKSKNKNVDEEPIQEAYEEPIITEEAAEVEPIITENADLNAEVISNDDAKETEVLNFPDEQTTEPSIEDAPLATNNEWDIKETTEVATPDSEVVTPDAEVATVTETGEDLTQPISDAVATDVKEEPNKDNEIDEDIWKF